MINPIFKKYDFLYNYFETYIALGKRFPQSIVFEGQDTLSAYFFATELARILNCSAQMPVRKGQTVTSALNTKERGAGVKDVSDELSSETLRQACGAGAAGASDELDPRDITAERGAGVKDVSDELSPELNAERSQCEGGSATQGRGTKAITISGEDSTITSKNEACTCTNCNWIKEGKHPAVISVTPLDFKDDTAKTVISVKQTEKITSLINEMSAYHRFFIFSNAKIAPYTASELNKISKFNEAGYSIPTENWYPAPLNRKILQEEASNSLLKSTEEAPNGVTFIFLTNTKENIISTIVSRSLVFKIPSVYEKNQIDVSEFFINYPNISIDEAMLLTKRFLEKIDTENLDIISVLDGMEEYLTAQIKAGGQGAILDDIKKIETAKKWLLATVQPKYAIESLFISLSNEGKNL